MRTRRCIIGLLLIMVLLAACSRATPGPQATATPASPSLVPTLLPTPTIILPSPASTAVPTLPSPTPTIASTPLPPTPAAPSPTVPPTVPALYGGALEIPAPNVRATLPLHVLARAGQPGEQIVATLAWDDGTQLARTFTALQGEDGRGLLVENLDWATEGPPPQPPTQPAVLTLSRPSGEVLAQQSVTMLSADDPDTQVVTLYWVLGDTLVPVQRRIPRTVRIGTAALEELLWGPGGNNLAGFETALPSPAQVLAYPGRGPDWGPRITLRTLTIVDGVATADFSREMAAHQGGSLRVMLIRQQISQTLMQFSTVREVRITVEGRDDVLEP